jgi:hypothetical protein
VLLDPRARRREGPCTPSLRDEDDACTIGRMPRNKEHRVSATAGLVVATALLVALPATAKDRSCTPELAKAAEEATDGARRGWKDLHDQYVRYVRRAGCDDGGIAEGWTAAVGHLLASRWGELPKLCPLAREDPDFLAFVLKHIDVTIPGDDLDAVRTKATTACPRHCEELCEKVRLAVDAIDSDVPKGAGR